MWSVFVCACLALSVVGVSGSAQADCLGARDGQAQGDRFAKALRFVSSIDIFYCQSRPILAKADVNFAAPRFSEEQCLVVNSVLKNLNTLDEMSALGLLPSLDEFPEHLEAAKSENIHLLNAFHESVCGDDSIEMPEDFEIQAWNWRKETERECFPVMVHSVEDEVESECAQMSPFVEDIMNQYEALDRS